MIEKIIDLSKVYINFLIKTNNSRYKWHETYFKWLQDEILEVKEEIENNRQVYLEDELWDMFWDYCCILKSLEKEWKIDSSKVFERCYKKMSQRVEGRLKWEKWDDIKIIQKQELLQEHNLQTNK